jgi:hypothetical protein
MCPKDAEGISIHAVQNSDCKKYAICSDGTFTEFECADGALFSPNATMCVRKSTYNCPDSTADSKTQHQHIFNTIKYSILVNPSICWNYLHAIFTILFAYDAGISE